MEYDDNVNLIQLCHTWYQPGEHSLTAIMCTASNCYTCTYNVTDNVQAMPSIRMCVFGVYERCSNTIQMLVLNRNGCPPHHKYLSS